MGFGGLYISVSGINANKKALDTISHNIANVNNPYYVRQSAIHAESFYSKTGDMSFQKGTGVTVQQIRQIRDEFLDVKLRKELAIMGYHSSKSEILNQVETIFNEIGSSGLQNVMDEFWDGWSELCKEPDSLTIRGIVHESAVALTTTINHIGTQLNNLQTNLNKEMLNRTDEVNSLLKGIASLNDSIKEIEGRGTRVTANDYRDTRNGLLDRLSQLIPISHYEDRYGQELVSLFGKELVGGGFCNTIAIEMNERGHGEIHWSDTGERIDLKGLGELGGYIDARDRVVVEYAQRLDILVSKIADSINEIHMRGKSLDWKEGDLPEEIPFFIVDNSRDPSASIRVNPELEDFRKIAISASGAKGDGEIGEEILRVREDLLFGSYDQYEFDEEGNMMDVDNTHMTIDGFYRDLVLAIGLERQQSRTMVENQGILISQIENRRREVSSVSLDEEMADMLKYQHSYIANSRVVNAIDEMIENIVNRMGIVGR